MGGEIDGRASSQSTAAALVTALLCFAAAAGTSVSQPGRDAPRLRAAFAGVSQAADHIMVIDTSGSMGSYWSAVMGAIADYTDALPDGDHVSIVCFDTEATNSRVLPRTLDERSRRELRAELLALPRPRGQRTDLGRGLTKLVDEVARPDAHTLQFVFLVSDFVHEPADGSAFTSTSADAPPWRDLADRAQLAVEPRLVQNFALLLPLDGRVGRDLPLVRSVLGETEGVPIVNQDTLREWFARRKAEIVRAKLRVLVRRDVARGVQLEFRPSEGGAALAVTSAMQHLPVVFTASAIAAEGVRIRERASRALEVAPGQSAALVLELYRPAPDGWLSKALTTRRTRVERVSLSAEGSLRLEPADELGAALQIEPEREARAQATLEAPVTQEGTPPWLQGAALLVVALLSWGVWRAWLRPAAPVAQYVRVVSLHGPGRHGGVDIPIGPRVVTIGNVGAVDASVPMAEPRFSVRLLSRRPTFPLLRPRRGLYVVRLSGDVYYEGDDMPLPVPDEEGQAMPVDPARPLLVRATPRPLEISFGN